MSLLQLLQETKPGNIFAKGTVMNHPLWIYMTNYRIGELMKRVAVKGTAGDWTLYLGRDDSETRESVAQSGDKTLNNEMIMKLMNATDDDQEFMQEYRG